MNRRGLLKGAASALLLPRLTGAAPAHATVPSQRPAIARVRPGDPDWPSPARWEELRGRVDGNLIEIHSPLRACEEAPAGAACDHLFKELKNPYFIGDDVVLTQTTGWVDAWSLRPSVYAVAARKAEDVVAAVNFAREHNLRLVVKGGGHSYLGTSNAPDSLLIWTRAMNDIVLRPDFVAEGCAAHQAPQPAVTIGAGAIWMHTYNEVTTKGGRFVQGGGCGTVGVAGLVQGGGFGSYSKAYGTAAAGLLEAQIVTADGAVRIANACTNPDLFWGLKGGGGGSLGVVTRMTLRTRELPAFFGVVLATIDAASDEAFRRLIASFVSFYAESLLNPHWGEIVKIHPGNRLEISMEWQGFDQQSAATIWRPFLDGIESSGNDLTFRRSPQVLAVPARNRWDPAFFRTYAPEAVRLDDRPGAPEKNIFWSGNLAEAGHFLHGFESLWLPAALLQAGRREELVDALIAAGKIWTVELHFQKGLAGASAETLADVAETATNPAVLDAFVLAIIAGEGPPAYPGLKGREPDLGLARRHADRIRKAKRELDKVAPDAGSYVAESSFFEREWQHSYWGPNYARLTAIKKKYDPDCLFFCHHGVGTEGWSDDGFKKVEAAQSP
ncbi:MAG: FAD-dependent oxidoreductase [Hyphomicrobiales bacterium]|nr:FAD-dependent oxidoreductase [Hyphomicrobiales bacterium]